MGINKNNKIIIIITYLFFMIIIGLMIIDYINIDIGNIIPYISIGIICFICSTMILIGGLKQLTNLEEDYY